MMISTKGRYALRVMLDLAGHMEDGYIPLAEIGRAAAYFRKIFREHPLCSEQGGDAERPARQGRRL